MRGFARVGVEYHHKLSISLRAHMLRWRSISLELPPEHTRVFTAYGKGSFLVGTFRRDDLGALWFFPEDGVVKKYLPGFFSRWVLADEFWAMFEPE